MPTFIMTCIGYVCDKKTYNYVKTNTFGNENQLTEQQKMLLHIPLNAVKSSLLSFLPFFIIPLVRFFGDVSDLARFHGHVIVFCFIQGSRITIILTCLLKANQVNQVEVSREQAREERRKWENENSFKAKKARNNVALDRKRPSTNSMEQSVFRNKANLAEISRGQGREERRKWENEDFFKAKKTKSNVATNIIEQSDSRNKERRQILDPSLLKMIIDN